MISAVFLLRFVIPTERANLFFVDGRAVSVDWRGGGWDVRAREVSDPHRWRAGNQVFARNS